jgi:tetratricopeptide (TPR) repeat protein
MKISQSKTTKHSQGNNEQYNSFQRIPAMLLLFLFFITSSQGWAQEFQRKKFNYDNYPIDTTECNERIKNTIDTIYGYFNMNQSKLALRLTEKLMEGEPECASQFIAHAEALYQNGEWLDAMQIMDSAVGLFGVSMYYLYSRGIINIEMGDIGTKKKYVDGAVVYFPNDPMRAFDESNFKRECYEAALSDFTYLYEHYYGFPKDLLILGYLHQRLGNLTESNRFLVRALDLEEIRDDAIKMLIDNHIELKNYTAVETLLENLRESNPNDPQVYKYFIEYYKKTGNTKKLEESIKAYNFALWAPEFTGLTNSKKTYERLQIVNEINPIKEKVKVVTKIAKKKDDYAIGFLVAVLYSHNNHGNGLEELCEKLLINIGEAAVPKTIALLNNNRSTCTIAKSARILTKINDPRGWDALVAYLPQVINLGPYITPPNYTIQMVNFNKEKALPVIIEEAKTIVDKELNMQKNDMSHSLGYFQIKAVFDPLQAYTSDEIKVCATSKGYNEEEVNQLLEFIFDNDSNLYVPE